MTNILSNSKQVPPALTRVQKRRKRDRTIIIFSVVAIVLAWVVGYLTSGMDVAPLVAETFPNAAYIDKQGDLYIAYNQDRSEVIGYAAIGEAPGYSGPIDVLVGVDPAGNVTEARVIKQRETPGFFRLVVNADLLSQFTSRQVDANFMVGEGIDGVSGATLSTEGVAAAARMAIAEVAANGLDRPIPQEKRGLQFGGPEIVLLLLFVVGYFGHKMKGGPWKRRVRWGTMLAGIVFLGFIYTAPLTITMVTSFLSGYLPDWHNNLYWYLLIGGILFVTLVDGKNPYCSWFCPFGAVQESMASLTGAKFYRPKDLQDFFTWLQRGLALTAIVLGLAVRRPGVAGYEPFATLFDLTGNTAEWLFLGLILIASLLIYRPFCTYLCPIDPTVDLISALRRWGKEVWRTWRTAKN